MQRNQNEHNFLSAVTFIGQASPSPRRTRQAETIIFFHVAVVSSTKSHPPKTPRLLHGSNKTTRLINGTRESPQRVCIQSDTFPGILFLEFALAWFEILYEIRLTDDVI